MAKDEGSRVLISPTALLGACEIDKTEKFLLTLHSSNAESFLEVVTNKKAPDPKIEGFRVLSVVAY